MYAIFSFTVTNAFPSTLCSIATREVEEKIYLFFQNFNLSVWSFAIPHT